VALGKTVAAYAFAATLFLCACADLRPLGTLTTGGAGGAGSTGAAGAGGIGSGGTTGAGGVGGDGGLGGPAIQVLVWNNALTWGHASRALAIPYLEARERTDNIRFDTAYAHTGSNYQDGPTDTVFDASVFTDEGLDKYDVVMFLNTTGNTIDDAMKTVRRQALQDFIEKKARGLVGVHSATDTYQNNATDPWPWYVDFIGANYVSHTFYGTPGVAQYFQDMTHPILIAASTPPVWNRSEEWFVFTRDPLLSPIPGVKMLLTCHDQINATERPSAWVHEMPAQASAPRGGRMFYTAFGHFTSAFEEPPVMDLIIAGIKWAAGRL
jgi:type 1 glutamine amidotransferase